MGTSRGYQVGVQWDGGATPLNTAPSTKVSTRCAGGRGARTQPLCPITLRMVRRDLLAGLAKSIQPKEIDRFYAVRVRAAL